MTLREHLDQINAALVTGEYGRIDKHIKAMRAILDEAPAANLGIGCRYRRLGSLAKPDDFRGDARMSLHWRVEDRDGNVLREGRGPYVIDQGGFIRGTVSCNPEIIRLASGERVVATPSHLEMPA